MIPAGQAHQSRAGVDAHVMRSRSRNVRRQYPLTRTDVENPFIPLGIKQIKHGRNHNFAVVLTPASTYPPVIVLSELVPARLDILL